MERAAFVDLLTKGPEALPGIILNVSGLNGDAAARIKGVRQLRRRQLPHLRTRGRGEVGRL
jgi:hypothetical protein